MKRLSILLVLAGVLTAGTARTQGHADRSVGALRDYFDCLASGNLDVARTLWYAPSLQRASKFGIEFTGIPIKPDCNSPIMRDLDLYRPYLYIGAQQVRELDTAYARLEFNQMIGTSRVTHLYYTYYDGDYFWLVYAQDFYARDWPIKETKYFRIHRDPQAAPPNQIALDEADRFVERMADRIDLPGGDLKTLEKEKIDYFFCGSDSTVLKITGHLVKGMLDQASNDLISAFFPHYHELIHLLINVKLKHLPLYTQPLMREGIAVALGGRWGKQPEALMDLGAFLHREEIIQFDSLLTMPFFESSATADIAYPVAGVFNRYLWDRLGPDGYEDVFRVLSGVKLAQVYNMTMDDTKAAIIAVTGDPDWATLMTSFNEYADNVRDHERGLLPGNTDNGKELYRDRHVRIDRDGDWYNFRFVFSKGEELSGNLLFDHRPELKNLVSDLFMEQYTDGRAFPGARFGLKFDENEAGLYDYATNHLVAKYIFGITPSDDYINPARNVIAVRLHKNVLGDVDFDEEDMQFLTN